MSNCKYCKLSKLRGVWVLADCSVTCVCFHCDADMSVMHVSWSRRWDQGEEEDGWSSGHVRRHVRKRGVHLSRLWGGRPGRASVRRQHRLASVQIDKGETSRKQHQRNFRHVSAACFFLFLFFLLFCSSMHNGFPTPDTKLTSGIAFKRTSCSLL